MAEATRSTPIQNLQNPVLNQNNGPNISTAEGVLQKYRELENDMPMPARGDQPSQYDHPLKVDNPDNQMKLMLTLKELNLINKYKVDKWILL